jgi:RHS repeat-associated protein
MLIDPQRDVAVWRWSLLGESFGSGGAAEDPDQDGVDQLFELRFPGQRQDPSSGLTYNYFRDYEPRTGRYAQSDPIGLNGGFNTFLYAEGDALALIDPYGLQGFKPPPRFARPGGGNARQRAIHNSAQMRQISRNSHSTPIYSRGVSPEDVGSAENLASLVSGLDYTQYCAAALCRDNPMECSTRDEIITNWMPSNPTVAQVHARGCTCLQPYYIDQPPINEPKAEALDWLQGLKYIRKRR